MLYWIDIKYALRKLLQNPVFCATSVLMVGIGLGLALYTFSLLNQLIFKPLTLNGASALVAIEGEFIAAQGRGQRTDPYHLNLIRDETKLLQGMATYQTGVRTISGTQNNASANKVHLTYSQWNLFEVAGVQPILGRGFNPQDEAVGAESVVVLSYEVWQNQFLADPDIVGRTILVEAIPKQVVGVMPEGFAFPAITQIWQSMANARLYPSQPSNRLGLNGVGRLKPGVSLSLFQQELRGLLQRQFQLLPQEYAWRATSPGGYIRAFPFKLTEDSIAQHYSVFVALLLVVLLILALTSINVGNMLLIRVNERIKDVAIRISLGIPRKRLVWQMLWESIFICGLGAVIALFLASQAVELTNLVFTQIFAINGERPFWWVLGLDNHSILVLLACTLFMIVCTGFIPARRALSADQNAVLRDGTRGALGKKANRINSILVVSEIALSCVVLVVASMLLSTSLSAQKADYGVQTENRITASVRLAWGSYNWQGGALEARKKRSDAYYQLQSRLEQLPNIQKVAYFSNLPGTGGGSSHFEIQGKAAPAFNENPMWNFEVVSRGAWPAVGMRIIEGRDFDLRDTGLDSEELADTESPVIINAALARDLFPEGNAIGQRVRTVTEDWQTEWRTIIGVVSDSIHGPISQATSAQHTGYGLMERRSWWMDIAVHYSGTQAQAIAALHNVIDRMDADISVHHIQSYDDLIKQPMLLVDAVNQIFLWCGLVALFLAASGIYAVAANSINLRQQEIATRRAIGCRDKQVVFLFLKHAAVQLLLGLTFGLALALWLVAQISDSMILDGNSYLLGLLGIPTFICMLVLIATYLPAAKSVRDQPIDGLRQG